MDIPSSDEIHRLTVEEFDTTKLLAHAARQARARKLHGADLRWWTSPEARAEWGRVLAACYPPSNGAPR